MDSSLLLIALPVLLVVAIVIGVSRVFRTHDPKRAAASTEIDEEGAFALALPDGGPVEVCFRFTIEGQSTDDDYSIAVGVELVMDGSVRSKAEWYTGDRVSDLGFATPQRVPVDPCGHHDGRVVSHPVRARRAPASRSRARRRRGRHTPRPRCRLHARLTPPRANEPGG